MKEFFKDTKTDKTIRFGFLTSLALSIIIFIFILLFYNNLPPFIPIFNQLPWGEQRLGAKITIFIPIAVNLLVLIFNFGLSAIIYKKVLLVSRMLATNSLLITMLIFLFIIETIKSIL